MTAGVTSTPESQLSQQVARRDNNFDAVRILAALFVIIGHGFGLTGRVGESPDFGALAIEYIGVAVFFAVSGYLITGSWERSRSVGQYVSSRALRIAPLLFLVVLSSTFVLGPVVTVLPLGEYFASAQTWNYLVNLVLLPADGLPGVFTTVPYPGVVNGSIWTLRAEVICYAVVLLLGFLPRTPKIVAFMAFALVSMALFLQSPVLVEGLNLSAASGTWIYFAMGALARLLFSKAVFRPLIALAVLVCWIALGVSWPYSVLPLSWIVLPYVVLSFGLASTPGIRRAARFGDLSYGLYLWAFPVQQVVVMTLGVLPLWIDIPLVAVLTAVLAFASWHLLEKRALEARFRLPWFREPARQR